MVLVIDDVLGIARGDGLTALPLDNYDTNCLNAGEWFRDILLEEWNLEAPVEPLLLLINANFKFGRNARRSLRHGIELLQHLRLTRNMAPAIKSARVVLYTFEDPNDLHTLGGGNLIIYSPGTALIRLPEQIDYLRNPSQWSIWLACLPSPDETTLRPYVKAADEADLKQLYSHSYRNRAGVLKFVEEFAGLAVGSNHEFIKEARQEELADIEQKRLLFLMPKYARGTTVDEATVRTFANICSGHRFLYIDDEHSRGWSLALHAGMTGTPLNPTEYAKLCSTSRGFTSDGLLHVISSFDEAQTFLDEKAAEVKTLQMCWIDKELAIAKEQKLSIKLDTATRSHQAASDILERQRNLILDLKRAGDMVRLRAHTLKEQGANGALRKAKAALQKCEEELESATAQVEICKTTCSAQVELLSRVFPFTAVLLDVRLEPKSDELAAIGDISGFKLLRQLRTSFAHIPVILMTASENAGVAKQALEMAVESFWTKGVSPGEALRQAILRYLERESDQARWAKLTALQGRRVIRCQQWDKPNTFSSISLSQGTQHRKDLHALLIEAFLILYSHRWKKGHFLLRHPWNAVVRILGIVQEIRWQNVTEDLWLQVPPKELSFHKLRNQVAHANRTRGSQSMPEATEQEAFDFFDLTVNELLQ